MQPVTGPLEAVQRCGERATPPFTGSKTVNLIIQGRKLPINYYGLSKSPRYDPSFCMKIKENSTKVRGDRGWLRDCSTGSGPSILSGVSGRWCVVFAHGRGHEKTRPRLVRGGFLGGVSVRAWRGVRCRRSGRSCLRGGSSHGGRTSPGPCSRFRGRRRRVGRSPPG